MTEKQLNTARIWSLVMSEDKKDKKEAAKMVKEFIEGYLEDEYKDLISMDDLVLLESFLILDGMIKVGKEKDIITRLYSNLAPIIMKRLNGDKGHLFGLIYNKFYQPIKELREFAEKKKLTTEAGKIAFIQAFSLIDIDKEKALILLDKSIGVVPNNCVEALRLYIDNHDYKIKFVDANDTEFYIGELSEDGAFNGFGTYYFDNGARYVGNFVNDVMEGQGTYYYANGEYESGSFVNGQLWKGNLKYKKLVAFDNGFYEGEFQHEKRNGYGIYVWDGGSYYEGEWKDSNMHGIGTYYYSDGTKDEGLWENDKFVGPVDEKTKQAKKNKKEDVAYYGEKSYPDGYYKGEFLNGMRHGEGTFTFNNGDEYWGDWYYDDRSGHGNYIEKNGDHYSGYFVYNKYFPGKKQYNCSKRLINVHYKGEMINGEVTGYGVATFDESISIEGYFINGRVNGYANIKYGSGAKYEGYCENGLRHGFGKYIWADGVVEEGTFKNDTRAGYFKVYYNDGEIFECEYANNKANGLGKYYYTDGSRLEVNYVDDLAQGEGITYFPNGDYEVGQYIDDEHVDIGTYYFSDGTKEVCIWENGEFVGLVSKEKKVVKRKTKNGKQKLTLSELIKATYNPSLFDNPDDCYLENSCEYYGQFVEEMKEHYNSGCVAEATEILSEISNIDFNEIAMPLIDILGDVGSVGFDTYFLTALQVIGKKISFGQKPFANLCYYMYKHNFTDEWINDDFIWCYFNSRACNISGPESLWFERLLANNDVHKPVTPDAEKRNIYIFNEEEYGKELDNYLRKDYKMSSNLELKPKDFFE